ncbi:MAG: hypothetical protein Q8Q88_19640 [Phenylobacterium sp.]|uniref:hypothetical protein n=1 Tax=Phenylobacterium sp. TaxID=1871053 RepID=UPI00273615B6|nr:hypothetical protein [Phenylobacterium sp.]MDP3749255.1 hypothetical protein [Phenylobacterium sp.]
MLAALSIMAAGGGASAQSYGQWQSYMGAGYKYARQVQGNGAIFGTVGVTSGAGGFMELYHTGPNSTTDVCAAGGNVERFDVQYCSMTNITTSAVTYDQFDVYIGVRAPTGTTVYKNQVETGSDRKTILWYDNNASYLVDSGDTGYYVSCPNDGHPYAIHDIQGTATIMQTWFRGDAGGGNYTTKFFWQGRVSTPSSKSNPNWGASGASASSVMMSEAFWCEDTTGNSPGCAIGGTWQVGAGNTGAMSDSLTWPTGAGVLYGRNVWHSLTAPFWWHDSWYPDIGDDGSDNKVAFSGC